MADLRSSGAPAIRDAPAMQLGLACAVHEFGGRYRPGDSRPGFAVIHTQE
jgi:hypothetical protein